MSQGTDISMHLNSTLDAIRRAEQQHSRPAHSVTLVAVSKQQPVEKIHAAYAAGQRDFSENYVQEALQKIKLIQQPDIIWHFIGAIQSNKTRLIAENFQWVHSVSRYKTAERLSEQRPASMVDLNVCIEVNIDSEVSKSGINVNEAKELALHIAKLPRIKLRGLMAIPAARDNYDDQVGLFKKVAALQQELNDSGLQLDTLSMGMSQDYLAAIAAGSTLVRIGTALFGTRNYE